MSVSLFESAAPEFSPSPVKHSGVSNNRVNNDTSNQRLSNDKQSGHTTRSNSMNDHVQYTVVFPPGQMGLELEPVITSSERTIGCRVRDYYFGVDHAGIDEEYLRANIMIGDIIIKVNEEPVVSMPFERILDLLRGLRTQSRSVMFKNITASCTFR